MRTSYSWVLWPAKINESKDFFSWKWFLYINLPHKKIKVCFKVILVNLPINRKIYICYKIIQVVAFQRNFLGIEYALARNCAWAAQWLDHIWGSISFFAHWFVAKEVKIVKQLISCNVSPVAMFQTVGSPFFVSKLLIG